MWGMQHFWQVLTFGAKSSGRLCTLLMDVMRSDRMGHSWSTATMRSFRASIAVMKCCTVSAT